MNKHFTKAQFIEMLRMWHWSHMLLVAGQPGTRDVARQWAQEEGRGLGAAGWRILKLPYLHSDKAAFAGRT